MDERLSKEEYDQVFTKQSIDLANKISRAVGHRFEGMKVPDVLTALNIVLSGIIKEHCSREEIAGAIKFCNAVLILAISSIEVAVEPQKNEPRKNEPKKPSKLN